MLVKLTYFTPSGKYYSKGSYTTNKRGLYDIWDEVEDMRVQEDLPGLSPGPSNFIISVDVPDHLHRHPRLLLIGSYVT